MAAFPVLGVAKPNEFWSHGEETCHVLKRILGTGGLGDLVITSLVLCQKIKTNHLTFPSFSSSYLLHKKMSPKNLVSKWNHFLALSSYLFATLGEQNKPEQSTRSATGDVMDLFNEWLNYFNPRCQSQNCYTVLSCPLSELWPPLATPTWIIRKLPF